MPSAKRQSHAESRDLFCSSRLRQLDPEPVIGDPEAKMPTTVHLAGRNMMRPQARGLKKRQPQGDPEFLQVCESNQLGAVCLRLFLHPPPKVIDLLKSSVWLSVLFGAPKLRRNQVYRIRHLIFEIL
jgi:hypothetical protein